MPIPVNDGLEVAAPRAVDLRSGKIVGGASVPYADLDEAKAAILSTRRYIGLPVNVNGVIYVFKNGITDFDLVVYDGRPYKSYVALLNQTGTGAPVATVIENTLGAPIVWTRTGVGLYKGTLAAAFTAEKSYIPTQSYVLPNGNRQIYYSNSTDEIFVAQRDTAGVFTDGMQADCLFEIRVFY